ncbi:terminase large subunit domain-containing protein [Natrialbaceae archaeon GCM10025896]
MAQFAEEAGVSEEEIRDRWRGRPDRIAEDLFRVKDLDTGEVRDLTLFRPYQPKIMHAYFYGDASTLNIYKGRRIGVSFIIIVCEAIDGLINPNSFFPIVSSKEEQAQARIRDLKILFENAKIEIPFAKTPTQSEIVLWNGTRYKAYTGNPEGARGDDSAKTVFIDEMAFLEDQEATSRAFSPFVSLGTQGLMVEVSTPLAKNDLFMRNHARGTETGYDENCNKIGTISIKQPSFANADEIDVEVSLLEQEVIPVRPDLNIEKVEEDRVKDPQGFAQEYLCRPIDDSYRFFNEESVVRAQERSQAPDYQFGLYTPKLPGVMRTMGVDIGIDHDDTVVTVFDHLGEKRDQRYLEKITNDVLAEAGVPNPDRGNAVHVAHRIAQIYSAMGVDYVILDKTGPGETFQRIIEEKLGRGVIGFNFSDKDAVNEMMGDMNAALRNDNVTLLKDEEMYDQFLSIVKEQKHDGQKPRYSGKDHSESGKDDVAMACVLGAFPPGLSVEPAREMVTRDPAPIGGEGVVAPYGTEAFEEQEKQPADPPPAKVAYGSRGVSRGTRRSYTPRYARRRSRF